MLVLTRRHDEKVILSHPAIGNITVLVVEIRGGERVKLGFSAPPEVTIHREEVAAAIEREKAKPSIEAIEGTPPTIL